MVEMVKIYELPERRRIGIDAPKFHFVAQKFGKNCKKIFKKSFLRAPEVAQSGFPVCVCYFDVLFDRIACSKLSDLIMQLMHKKLLKMFLICLL